MHVTGRKALIGRQQRHRSRDRLIAAEGGRVAVAVRDRDKLDAAVRELGDGAIGTHAAHAFN
jgi:hypothetical protein